MDPRGREEEWLRLQQAIQDWNATRMDLFEISNPDERLEFHGVMRFFFQDATDKSSNSKCIRVSSTATTRDVINILIEKFHPDMRMLSIPDYCLFELQRDMDDRQLQDEERPLLVQLNWTKDLKEGRFLLRQVNDPTKLEFYNTGDGKQKNFEKNAPKRLSKREKKELKKERKLAQLKGEAKAYDALAKSNFTRTISNPENVLRRKRQQKQDQIEKYKSRPESGGTFKVYAHTTFPEVPYKTLLVSINTMASDIIRESLDKFGALKANPADFCLAKVVVPPGHSIEDYGSENFQEAILDEDEYPMDAVLRWPESRGELAFELKRKPSDYQPRLKRPGGKHRMDDSVSHDPNNLPPERLPYFLELNNDGTDIIDYKPKHYRLQTDVTEVGSQREPQTSGPYLQFVAPDILPRHCVLTKMEGVVTVTPTSAEADIFVHDERIYETTILQHGAVVHFGRHYTFRFCDPQVEDPDWDDPNKSHVETTFDADGSIETYGKPEKVRDPNSEVLPLSLEFRDTAEDMFFEVVVREVNGAQIYFKLAPTYTLYLACRYRLSKLYRPEMGPTERAQRLSAFLNKMADIIDRTVEEDSQVAGALTFWLANVSELLHFITHDHDIGGISQDAQDILHSCVQNTFRHLVRAMQIELTKNLSAFLDPSNEADMEKDFAGDVLQIMSSAMTLLRVCRVNAALTIQLFSQLFHFINATLFNQLVTAPRHAGICTQEWGHRLMGRLARIDTWAEKQGLELAAEAHLEKLKQALGLLMAQKENSNQLNEAIASCWKLNTKQMKALLDNYIPPKGAIQIPPEAIAKATSMAASEEELEAQREGHPILLEEERELRVPAFLPDDGYSSDIVKGIPNGLAEFLNPLIQAAQVRLTPHPKANGKWTVYMYGNQPSILEPPSPDSSEPPQSPPPVAKPRIEPQVKPDAKPQGQEPEVITIQLNKHGKPGMGLSIIAATGAGQDKIGIYVKAVVPGSAAEKDGRVQAGDQILAVDGNSLLGLDQDAAAQFLVKSGQIVEMKIAKQGAIFHGLAQILSQTTPPQQRAYKGDRPPRPVSEDLSGRSMTLPPGMGPPKDPKRDPRDTGTMPRGVMGVPLVGLREADKARSSPNLAEDRPQASERGNYMPMDSNDYPRHGSIGMRPEPRSRNEVTPTPPINQRSKSVSNLDPEPVDPDVQRPVKSTADLSHKKDEQPYRGHAPREEPPFRREDGPRPGVPGRPQLEDFDQEPYRRQPGDPRRESPDQRPIPQQRGLPQNQMKPAPQPRQVQQQLHNLQHRHRGPPPSNHPGQYPSGQYPPGQYPQGPMAPGQDPRQRMPMQHPRGPPGPQGMGSRGPPPQQRMPDGMQQPDRYGPPTGFRVGPQGDIQRQSPQQDGYGMPPRHRVYSQGDVLEDMPQPRNRVYSEGHTLRDPEYHRLENRIESPQPAPRMMNQGMDHNQKAQTDLPPPPPELAASQGSGSTEDLPPPPPTQQSEEEEYRQWQEQRDRQIPSSGFASLPRQGRINRSSSLTRDSTPVGSENPNPDIPQKPVIGPKPVPPPMPPERTIASAEAARGSIDRRTGEVPNSGRQDDRYAPQRVVDPANRSQGLSPAGSSRPTPSSKTSPWDREEKEKQEKRFEEQVKHMRDEEIHYLASLPSLHPAQQERLNKLQLDQAFQQRLEESMMEGDDDEEEENLSNTPEYQQQMAMAGQSAALAVQRTQEKMEQERQQNNDQDIRQRQERRVQELQMQRQLERQREIDRQRELQKQQELGRQQELQRREEMRKQDMTRQQEVQRQQELERRQERERQQEIQRRQEELRQQEMQREQERLRQQEMQKEQERLRQQEMQREQERLRQQEIQREQERQRQEELRQQEMQRQMEEQRQRQMEEQRQRQIEEQRQREIQQQLEKEEREKAIAQQELKQLQEERARWMAEQEELRRKADEERRRYEEMKALREKEEEERRRYEDIRVMREKKEEEMLRRKAQYEELEAELERERRLLEDQLSFDGPKSPLNNVPPSPRPVIANVSAGFVPGPNRPQVQAAPSERPPTDGQSSIDAVSLNKPKPFKKAPPPIAPKRVTFRPGQRTSAVEPPLNSLNDGGSAGDRTSISSQHSLSSNNSGGAPSHSQYQQQQPYQRQSAQSQLFNQQQPPQSQQSSFGNGYPNKSFYTSPVSSYLPNHSGDQPPPNYAPPPPPTSAPPPPPPANNNSQMYSTPPPEAPGPVYRTGNTPGVIGAQEVYNDPRDKRLAQQQLQPKPPTPDIKMSFKEKMKLFSESSPSEKPKTSRWEREFLAQNPNLQ